MNCDFIVLKHRKNPKRPILKKLCIYDKMEKIMALKYIRFRSSFYPPEAGDRTYSVAR